MIKEKWYGDSQKRKLKQFALIKIEEIGQYIEGQAILKISKGATKAVDTGRLKGSITHEVGERKDEVYTRVGTNVKYATYVEFGTYKMNPRPFLRLGLKHSEKGIKRIMKAKFKNV